MMHDDVSMDALLPGVHEDIYDFTRESIDMFGDLKGIEVVYVAHAFENVLPLLQALSEMSELRSIIIKNSTGTLHPQVVERMRQAGFPVGDARKRDFADPTGDTTYLDELMRGDAPLLILDHGGYFAYGDALERLSGRPGGFIGVVEYTLNGEERYEERGSLPCPVLSVAQSRVKGAGDIAVSEAIVLEAEFLLSRGGIGLTNKRTAIGVVGQGRLGTAVAQALVNRGARKVWVDDFDPIRRASQRSLEIADTAALVAHCDVVFLATGRGAITPEILEVARQDTIFFTVTSPDDEIKLGDLLHDGVLIPVRVGTSMDTYVVAATGRQIHLGFGGEAPNMASPFGNTDPTIHLPNAAHLAAGVVLARHQADFPHAVTPVPSEIETVVSEVFDQSFGEVSTIH